MNQQSQQGIATYWPQPVYHALCGGAESLLMPMESTLAA
jgi:hypothetical protein